MKYKLKNGVEASDIPAYCSAARKVARELSNNSVVSFENLPKGLLEYVEEVVAPNPKKDNKGGK
tara:strand:+ start:459 stop:650 length:192 start_codon:yes stop_codon:yes gene_type:complete